MRSRSTTTIPAAVAVLVLLGCTSASLTSGLILSRGPDLAVSALEIQRGEPGVWIFTATVVNQGTNRASPSNVQFSLNVGSDNQWEVTAAALRIGQLTRGNSVTLVWSNGSVGNPFTWTAAAGKHRARVCADSGSGGQPSAVQESNETNNCTVKEFTVR